MDTGEEAANRRSTMKYRDAKEKRRHPSDSRQ